MQQLSAIYVRRLRDLHRLRDHRRLRDLHRRHRAIRRRLRDLRHRCYVKQKRVGRWYALLPHGMWHEVRLHEIGLNALHPIELHSHEMLVHRHAPHCRHRIEHRRRVHNCCGWPFRRRHRDNFRRRLH